MRDGPRRPDAAASYLNDLLRVHPWRRAARRGDGGGAEMRQSLGTAVLFGMIGVTCFGLLFTPAFYTFIRKLGRK